MDRLLLDDRLKELRVYETFRHRLEYRKLTQLLPAGKRIDAASGGIFRGNRWLFFLIEGSLVGVSANPVTGVETIVLDGKLISRVRPKKGLLFGSLFFTYDGKDEKIENMIRRMPEQFARYFADRD